MESKLLGPFHSKLVLLFPGSGKHWAVSLLHSVFSLPGLFHLPRRCLGPSSIHRAPGKPEKSWNFILTFSRTRKSSKRQQVLNSSNKVFIVYVIRNVLIL